MGERGIPPTINITRIDLLYSPKPLLPKEPFDRLTAMAAHKILGSDDRMKSFGSDLMMRGLDGEGRGKGNQSNHSSSTSTQGFVSRITTKMSGKKDTTGGSPLRG